MRAIDKLINWTVFRDKSTQAITVQGKVDLVVNAQVDSASFEANLEFFKNADTVHEKIRQSIYYMLYNDLNKDLRSCMDNLIEIRSRIGYNTIAECERLIAECERLEEKLKHIIKCIEGKDDQKSQPLFITYVYISI